VKVIDVVIAIFVMISAVYILVGYIKPPDDAVYDATNLKVSIFRDMDMMRNANESVSILIITKDYKRLILGSGFRKTEAINAEKVYSSCSRFGGWIWYSSIFPSCAGTIYAKNWSMSFQPVTGYITIKDSKR